MSRAETLLYLQPGLRNVLQILRRVNHQGMNIRSNLVLCDNVIAFTAGPQLKGFRIMQLMPKAFILGWIYALF